MLFMLSLKRLVAGNTDAYSGTFRSLGALQWMDQRGAPLQRTPVLGSDPEDEIYLDILQAYYGSRYGRR